MKRSRMFFFFSGETNQMPKKEEQEAQEEKNMLLTKISDDVIQQKRNYKLFLCNLYISSDKARLEINAVIRKSRSLS